MPAPFSVRAWREARGITQAAAAPLLGTPFRTYLTWDQGKRRMPPCVALLCAYIDAYGPLVEPPEDHGDAPATSAPHAA